MGMGILRRSALDNAQVGDIVARRSSLVARRSSLVARRSSLVARRSSLVARRFMSVEGLSDWGAVSRRVERARFGLFRYCDPCRCAGDFVLRASLRLCCAACVRQTLSRHAAAGALALQRRETCTTSIHRVCAEWLRFHCVSVVAASGARFATPFGSLAVLLLPSLLDKTENKAFAGPIEAAFAVFRRCFRRALCQSHCHQASDCPSSPLWRARHML